MTSGDALDTIRKRRQRSQSSPELLQALPDMSAESSTAHEDTGRSTPSGEPREETLTVRRREANRLAAQRFRSRKKGYQDSLEERIRVLEDERDELLRRMGEAPREAPDPSVDIDVRVAALESANRRLRDELAACKDENDKLRDELEAWRRWREDRPRALPPIDFGPPPGSGSGSGYMHPPLERTRSYPAPQPDVRLPPIRLPPLSPAISDTRHSPAYTPPFPRRYSHRDDLHNDR